MATATTGKAKRLADLAAADKRSSVCQGLREMADFLESHTEIDDERIGSGNLQISCDERTLLDMAERFGLQIQTWRRDGRLCGSARTKFGNGWCDLTFYAEADSLDTTR